MNKFSKLMLAAISLIGSFDSYAQPTYYSDVRPIIEANCLTCHSEKGVAFSFENEEKTYDYRMAIAAAVTSRRMPPWIAEQGHQEYVGDISLSQKQVNLIFEWSQSGYTKGEKARHSSTTSAKASSAPTTAHSFSSDMTLSVLPNDEYLPNQNRKDDYRCFIVDWPYKEKKYITGFKATPGNTNVAHHLVVLKSTAEVANIFRELPAAENGAGYQCFGGAVPDRLGDPKQKNALEAIHPNAVERLSKGSHWLAHWAPGMNGYEFPADTGVMMEPGAVLIVQMHYYSAFAPGQKDSGTTMDFTVADRVKKPALVIPLTRDYWLVGKKTNSMVIPPTSSKAYTAEADFSYIANRMAGVVNVPVDKMASIELHSVNVHMHSYGASGSTSLITHHGQKEMLLNIPRWDIDWQRDFTFVDPKIINHDNFSKTKLSVECNFSNSTNETVYGGFGSDDEMCFNFSYFAVNVKEDEMASLD